jgi:uncharacterized protein with beta-barrel porin domain
MEDTMKTLNRFKTLFAILVAAIAIAAAPAHAAGKSDTFENDVLKLIFNATAIANIADNASSSPLTNLYVELHTADPGDAGTATTSEASYTGYARVAIARTSGGWTVTGNSVSPVANVDFGECTASCTGSITNWSVTTASSGSTKILYSGAISPSISLAVGVIPRIKSTSTITED